MSTLFISHSSRDNAAAEALKRELEREGHRSVFLDLDPEKGIQAGGSWERTLYTKLRSCRAVVALCSDSYLASQWCFAEIALARMEGKELFVLQIEPWSADSSMPSILVEEQYIDLRTDPEAGYRRLWNGFKVKGITPAEHREWGVDDPPYPGLRAFEEADAPIFFGREREVRDGVELLNRILRHGHPRLAMVLGSSGSGKSSLARAGIVPQLRRDNRWLVVGPFLPGANPMRALAGGLAQGFDRVGETRLWKGVLRQLVEEAHSHSRSAEARDPARDRLLEALRTIQRGLTDTAADAEVARSMKHLEEVLNLASVDKPATPSLEHGGPLVQLARELLLLRGSSVGNVLLVIDQFEELLGHEDSESDHPATAFLQVLREALEAEGSPVFVLGTMRSDYLGALQRSSVLRGLSFQSLSVGPMTPEGMRQVIERPASLGQIEFEDGLVDLLLLDTGTPDALPLMAFTMRTMWDRYRDKRLLEIRQYKELGGMQGGMAEVADETLQVALSAVPEVKLRDAFLALARPAAEGVGWSRQPVQWGEFDEDVRPMLQRFIDQRLLVKRADGTVEVAHEALFRSWKTLRSWLDQNAEAIRLRQEIQDAADKWVEAQEQEKETYLWRGGRLGRALELRLAHVLPLEDAALSFLSSSEQAEARSVRLMRRWLFGSVAVAVVAVIALGLAWHAKVNAQRSLDRMIDRLVVQLESMDGSLSLSALVQLTEERGEQASLELVPDHLFESSRWYASIAFALRHLARSEPEHGGWAERVRRGFFARLSEGCDYPPPPTAAEDQQLNRRIPIAEGSFRMGNDSDSAYFPDEQPARLVTLSAFEVQEHEVTVREYWRFDPNHRPTQLKDLPLDEMADYPVEQVSWFDAVAYATWLGGSLPTEAQWEFAARGEAGRVHPWGDNEAPHCDLVNFRPCGNVAKPVFPLRERGKTPEGLYDMAGNVWEWCLDWYGPYAQDPQPDPLGLEFGMARILRGGSRWDEPILLRGAYRYNSGPANAYEGFGFRLVWPAGQAGRRADEERLEVTADQEGLHAPLGWFRISDEIPTIHTLIRGGTQ